MKNSWTNNIFCDPASGFCLDLNFTKIGRDKIGNLNARTTQALKELAALESGSLANPDEQRMVGHYWLRNPKLAPTKEIQTEITETLRSVMELAKKIRGAEIGKFNSCLLIGIGGSALGPQFLEHALADETKAMQFFYFDNTDPAGFLDVWRSIPDLASCLVVVISKSGGTRETRNGMLFAEHGLKVAGLQPERQMLAITQAGSALDRHATENNWIARIPMWDWVGGRTSLWSAVGILPALLQGIDVDQLLQGAAAMDALGRNNNIDENPALLLAATWYLSGNGQPERLLVILPYRDQLEYLSKYLQQLIMESLGKELDRAGHKVNQGLYVLGNKGSTDQHSYIQQLREGPNSFLAHFIEVLKDDSTRELPAGWQSWAGKVLEQNATAGDYLSGFLQGTRRALFDNGRPSITLTIPEVNAFYVGMLLALFERAVGFYASMINVNAYHQPGVEAGKKGAEKIVALQSQVLELLNNAGDPLTVAEIAGKLQADDEHALFCILRHLASNKRIKCSNSADFINAEYFI